MVYCYLCSYCSFVFFGFVLTNFILFYTILVYIKQSLVYTGTYIVAIVYYSVYIIVCSSICVRCACVFFFTYVCNEIVTHRVTTTRQRRVEAATRYNFLIAPV